MQNTSKRLSIWALIVLLLLTIPLILTIRDGGIEGVGWNWTPSDFIIMGTLLFGTGLAYELITRKAKTTAYKIAVGIAAVTSLLLIWINGAVGIIGGEDNPANLMYGGVLIVGFIGTVAAYLESKKMSYTLYATAVAQALVPILALIIYRPDFSPGVLGVFVLNTVFVALWIASGLLFRRASIEEVK